MFERAVRGCCRKVKALEKSIGETTTPMVAKITTTIAIKKAKVNISGILIYG
jgi:hypothetical protein